MKITPILGVVVVVTALILLVLRLNTDSPSNDESAKEQAYGNTPSPARSSRLASRKAKIKADQVDNNRNLAGINYTDEWNNATKTLDGNLLEQKRYQLLIEAKKNLKGVAYGDFLEAVYLLGNKNFIAMAMMDPFPLTNTDDPSAVIEWFVKLENNKFQSRIATKIGRTTSKEHLHQSLLALKSPKTKEMLLAGYCSEMSKIKPIEAVGLYMQLIPKNIGYESLIYLTGTMPDHTDFAAVSKLFPSDKYEKARLVRRSLLQRWARTDPNSAANYILKNKEVVAASQVITVLDIWYKDEAEAPSQWIENLESSEIKDVGLTVISKRQLRSSPSEAWSTAMNIGDYHIRDATIKEIYRDWVQHDPSSADNAREDYLERFPAPKKKDG